jgi:hypothetical protein
MGSLFGCYFVGDALAKNRAISEGYKSGKEMLSV